MHTSIHSEAPETLRHSPRNGFTTSSALSSGTNCFVDPVIRVTRWRPRELDACIGAPEPHGFAVRKQARSSVALSTSTASHPTFVTIASRPSWQGGMAGVNHTFPKNGSKIFFARGLDMISRTHVICPTVQAREAAADWRDRQLRMARLRAAPDDAADRRGISADTVKAGCTGRVCC